MSIDLEHLTPPHPLDPFGPPPPARGRVLVDGEGVAGAALMLGLPDGGFAHHKHLEVDAIARRVVLPVIQAAVHLLEAAAIVGRCRCQIDLVGLQNVLRIDGQSPHHAMDPWVPTATDLSLPINETAIDENTDLDTLVLGRIARSSARALARSANLRYWEPGGP